MLKYKVNYFPIVSSMRAFRILWKKSYIRTKEWLGGVVYELGCEEVDKEVCIK